MAPRTASTMEGMAVRLESRTEVGSQVRDRCRDEAADVHDVPAVLEGVES